MNQQNVFLRLVLPAIAMALTGPTVTSAHDGYLQRDGKRVLPIGCYELPDDPGALQEMANAGINLVRVRSAAELDRLAAVGIQGIVPLPLDQGPTDAVLAKINEVKQHPALAVWEGPDEVVWGFTALSTLYRTQKIYKHPDEWKRQTPRAIAYARSRAREIMPNIRHAVHRLRMLDPAGRPIWFNEAHESDVGYVRQYLDAIDITGCDLYPVKFPEQPVHKIGAATDRWRLVGKGKPVWMVLQAFSWHELGDYYGHKRARYPTFDESRFMAYDALVHGVRGILYWGSRPATDPTFRRSWYALTSELDALQPLLVGPDEPDIKLTLIESRLKPVPRGVRHVVRRAGDEWLVVLVNEDDARHMAVELSGLGRLDGRQLVLLYGDELVTVQSGAIVTRMRPFEVKIFATNNSWETSARDGRQFGLASSDG